MNKIWNNIVDTIDSYHDWVIEVQEKLTSIPALDPKVGGKGELAKARAIENILKEIGLSDIERIDAPDKRADGGIRPNIIGRIACDPTSNAKGRLWIMSHMDVVSEGDRDKWDSDPWKIRVEGDKIFGRGVEDNQQGIVASLLLARTLLENKITPFREICLLFVADEEVGSNYGIQYLLQHSKNSLFKTDDYIVVPDGGRPDGSQIEVAEKSILWLKFTVIGKSSHASTPERGVNAHRAAAHLAVALDQLNQTFNYEDPVFDPPTSTFEPTKREANVASVNILPGEDIFYLDCRILPHYSIQEVEAEVERHCKNIEERFLVTITSEPVQKESAAPPTANDAPVVKAVQEAVKNVYNVNAVPEGIGGGTVAAYIRHAGFPAVVWARMDETMHTANEYARISNIIGDAKVFAHLALF